MNTGQLKQGATISEQSMWKVVRSALHHLDPVRVENKCELGTPDVNLATGDWIELKIADKPKRGDTVIAVKHYTQYQRTWAIKRRQAGGKVWLLLKVKNDWLLLAGTVAAEYLGKVDLQKLKEVSTKVWEKKLDRNELLQHFR